MMSIILRRSSSSSARALASALNLVSVVQQRCQFSASSIVQHGNGTAITTTLPLLNSHQQLTRQFHVRSGPLSFKATLAAQAEIAVDDLGYEDEEGLEIAKLGISQEIVSALAGKNITKLFPIQKAVLEPAMQGRDMFGRARTGTGKTLAFGIPILDRIILYNNKHGRGRNPLALVMAPTRELARQVEKEFREAAPNVDSICVYGGTPISRQMRELDYGVDVVVGTPGRIIDLMKRGCLVLSEIQFVVLDEADMMLGVGFVDDIEAIFQHLPKNRQTMLFSATMPSWIRNLIRNYLKEPLTIDIVGDSDKKLADGISLYSIASDMYSKASILGPLVTEHAKGGKCIIFTETKREADRLANAMARNHRCEALHGDISQSVRERTLSGFRDGKFNILIATDVAARGLDVPNVDLVIHYALPKNSETFVHRSGRTGRAGKKGTAILIYTQDEHRSVKIYEREVGCRFTELSRITVDSGNIDMFDDMGSSGRYSSFGGARERGYGDRGFGRSGGQGMYGSGRFGVSHSDGQMNGPSRFGYDRNQSGNSYGSKFGQAGGFGESGRSNRGSSFGDFGSGRSSAFGDFGSGRSSTFGDFGSGRSDRFRESDVDSNSGSRRDASSRFGSFRDPK